MKILMIGDVVGNPGRRVLREQLRRIRDELGVAAVICNAENAAAGSGITVVLAKEIFAAGVDAITLGDHTWGQKEFAPTIGQLENTVRPANYPPGAPGKGWVLVTTPICRFAVLNLLGRVFMNPADCPFSTPRRRARRSRSPTTSTDASRPSWVRIRTCRHPTLSCCLAVPRSRPILE